MLTNSLSVVNRLSQYSDIAIIVLGGVLRRQEMSLLGHLTIAGLDEFGIDQVFTGAFGIDPEIGVTGTNLSETQTDRSLISSARELILLADHSKLVAARAGPARADQRDHDAHHRRCRGRRHRSSASAPRG